MSTIDFSVESEDEIYEDLSGWELTDKDLEEMLIRSRQTMDVPLRRLVKQAQYLRWLMPKLLELAEQSGQENTFIDLARGALRTTQDKKS